MVVTQPNNKLSRVLKALLRELPAQLAAADAAGLDASCAMSEGAAAAAAGLGGAEALDYAKGKLAERLRLVRGLQVRGQGRDAGPRTAVCSMHRERDTSTRHLEPSTRPTSAFAA